MPAAPLAILERIRHRRRLLRFSQRELAEEIGLSRSAVANYETSRLDLPFGVALAICRRLNLNPRWLASGEMPDVPFIPVAELGVNEAEMLAMTVNMGFAEGFERFLRAPIEQFLRAHSLEELVLRTIRGGPEAAARQASLVELERMLLQNAQALSTCDEWQRPAHLQIIRTVEQELSARITAARRRVTKRGQPQENNKSLTKPFDGTAPMGSFSPVQIAEKLKQVRDHLGLTQGQAAEKWGVPLGTLKKWEQGTRTPRGLGLRQLETILRTARQPSG